MENKKLFLFDGMEAAESDFWKILEDTVNDHCEDVFDDYIDECYPEEVVIWGMHFNYSQILCECDPTTYRCELKNFQSEELEKATNELECRGHFEINSMEFVIEEVEEEA